MPGWHGCHTGGTCAACPGRPGTARQATGVFKTPGCNLCYYKHSNWQLCACCCDIHPRHLATHADVITAVRLVAIQLGLTVTSNMSFGFTVGHRELLRLLHSFHFAGVNWQESAGLLVSSSPEMLGCRCGIANNNTVEFEYIRPLRDAERHPWRARRIAITTTWTAFSALCR